MSNRSYLTASNSDTIYPSFVQKGYEAETQLIASDVEALPLMWLAMFREEDLRREVFKVQGEEIPAFAPVCSKDRAIWQFDQAIEYLKNIFPNLGRIDEYASMFRSAIEPLPYRFVSIELEEIAGLYPKEHRFEELLTLGLRGFERPEDIRFQCEDVAIDLSGLQISFEPVSGDEDDEELMEEIRELNSGSKSSAAGKVTIEGFTAESHAHVLERLATLKPDVKLPPVQMYLDDLKYSDEESWNFTRVLGAGRHGTMGLGREVPWEKENADFGFKFIPYESDET